jgi:hypothetical protein
MSAGDYADLLLRLFVDLCALGLISILVARRRPRRGLFMVYATFNLGLFVVLTVISGRHVGPAIGFGLFAICRSSGSARSRSATRSSPISSVRWCWRWSTGCPSTTSC